MWKERGHCVLIACSYRRRTWWVRGRLNCLEPINMKTAQKLRLCGIPARWIHARHDTKQISYMASVLIAWDVTRAVDRSELIGRGSVVVRAAHVRWVDAIPTRNDGIISWWYCGCVSWDTADCELIGVKRRGLRQFPSVSAMKLIAPMVWIWCGVCQSSCQIIYQIRPTIGCKMSGTS